MPPIGPKKGSEKMEKVYVFGHRSPDTDSVGAAISLAYLKRKLGVDAVPVVLSSVNRESKYALDYFGVPEPMFINDVKIKIKDLEYTKNHSIRITNSIMDAYKKMEKAEISKVPVIDDKKHIVGIINMKDIASECISGKRNVVDAKYNNIINTLGGKEILRFDEDICGNVITAGYRSSTFLDEIRLSQDDVLIVGNRYSIIEYAILSKVKLIVLTGGFDMKEEHLELARKNGVNIIGTDMGTLETIKVFDFCNSVSTIMSGNDVLCVHDYDDLSDFVALADKTRYSYYPVLNKKGQYLGIIRFSDIEFSKRKKVILVDHNSLEQSAIGLDEADIIEIVDHHNISPMSTKSPIIFRNMPVGSTNTIIFGMYKENGIAIPKDIAGMMLSGILSDTLILTSPTTTDIDRRVVKELSLICGVDYEKYGMDMLKAGTSLKGKTKEEVLYMDFKTYPVNDDKIGLGNILTTNIEDIEEDRDGYIELLNRESDLGGYVFIALYVTDFIKNGSYVYYSDGGYDILKNIYGENLCEGYFLDGVLSRKKQILPDILREMENE